MKVLKILGIILVVLAIIIVGGSFLLPKESKVERSVMVGVNDSIAYHYVSDFSKFNEWSPWYEMEPSAEVHFEGFPGEVGSSYSWKGKKLGEGRLQITSVQPTKAVYQKLTFVKPWEGIASNNFFFEQVDDSTKVTWAYDQENKGIMAKWMGLCIDQMMGKDWDRGLSKIKANLEAKYRN